MWLPGRPVLLNVGLLDINAPKKFILPACDAADNLVESATAGNLPALGLLPNGSPVMALAVEDPASSSQVYPNPAPATVRLRYEGTGAASAYVYSEMGHHQALPQTLGAWPTQCQPGPGGLTRRRAVSQVRS